MGAQAGAGTVRVEVEAVRRRLLEQEDTDGDRRITVEDRGPRRFVLEGEGGGRFEVAGTHALAHLLEELSLAAERGEGTATLSADRLFENPVARLARRIREEFWDHLTRWLDAEGLGALIEDSKASGDRPRIYVPHSDPVALAHFEKAAARRPELEVVRLPERVTPAYVRGLNRRPGILSLALVEEGGRLRGVPFVVPGGRFNEMYGWDSYFEALGLLADGRVDLARAMVDNFVYQLQHYGRILNANRSYYLTRSQPPFLTAMARAVYERLPAEAASREWLAGVLRAAVREYETVWTSPPRLTETGLSRYHGEGIGPPPETEPGHFAAAVATWAARAGLDPLEYEAKLRAGEIDEPELAGYFVHDRSVRESGHDNSYRLEGRCADLVTVDLNALLFRYESDLAELIEEVFGGELADQAGRPQRPQGWRARAEERRRRMDELLWDAERGWFFDYDFTAQRRTGYESATALYPLWAGCASPAQAEALVEKALPALEAAGGLLASTEASRGAVGPERPQRQWDYPFGWAPHQMLAWRGLERYGFADEARRLAGRWLYTIARNAADYNGTVPEKYDVVARSHKVFAEYGNVGTEFDYITREGFGWMNASFQVGLELLDEGRRRALEALIPPEWTDGPAPAG